MYWYDIIYKVIYNVKLNQLLDLFIFDKKYFNKGQRTLVYMDSLFYFDK